ncbi:Predicted pyrophosphatase or phosphodiesterase, AlkP superfamily [Cyclobacterium lianum]|uniref:Predicted pyrophosphatase or phosphodiesterase, AlkP superfamily n=1 Tax=Cyclobacterium lianum TaxID=388280 RepID=A0A1M7IDG5_9BACT|nr:nucleotide pyrophosphatase/phosphodiesterase family protein [Cyclobacterium lianum]SHM38794.1 Predicted pyrophosphatase or phosphodiesterase, AlkP superfamily [Cyclobacterium lianum]
MKKTVVLNIVALSARVIGPHTPFLSQWIKARKQSAIKPVLPAVTCSAQSVYLTGKWPRENGIVGNGWYFKDECEIKFWRQSNHLVQAPKVWDALKAEDPNFTCANMFWWYNMYSSVDYAVTPRPLYPSDGRKLPDIHSQPMGLRDRLQKELGQFPLFSFWGPNANISSSKWIAEASMKVDEWHDPTLTFIYLPHLDYALQKFGIDFNKIGDELKEIDALCERLIGYYENRGAEIILLSEYGITSVNQPIHINRALRKAGYIQVKDELGLETLDAGTSKAFAVSDHQLAHVYLNDPGEKGAVKKLLEGLAGVEMVLDKKEQETYQLGHDRAGDLVAVADKDSWFTYYYWLDDRKAPDYARTVDIHRKPGYDPVEMFANPDIRFLKAKLGWTLLKKKLGFRYLMDVIPLDASLVKGSHGRISESDLDWPVLVRNGASEVEREKVDPTAIYSLIYDTVRQK